jgi:hypothetical protein
MDSKIDRLLLMVPLVACGEVIPLTPDAPIEMPDARVDAPPPPACNAMAPFGAPVPMMGVNGPNVECDAWMSPEADHLHQLDALG